MAEEVNADAEREADGEPRVDGTALLPGTARVAHATEVFVNYTELVAAAVFAALFAIGVGDLIVQIVEASLSGTITDPLVVIGFIDTGLLLLIIVEVYQTVIAYTTQSDRNEIVRLIIFTGVIAMVRKVIIFRTSEYPSTGDALFAAASYTLIIGALVALLLTDWYRDD